MMRDSNHEAVWCKGDDCDELIRIRVTVADAFGGDMYCDDCIEEGKVPENHPQHPDYDGHFEI